VVRARPFLDALCGIFIDALSYRSVKPVAACLC
jgi:hypothetical protein